LFARVTKIKKQKKRIVEAIAIALSSLVMGLFFIGSLFLISG